MQFNFVALALFAVTGSALVIEKRGGGGPPPPPLCDRLDWLDILYADITPSGTARLGFDIRSGLTVGQEYTIQLIHIPTCAPQTAVGSIAQDFKMTVEVQAWDETSSATYEAAEGATDITFPFSVPSNATALKGEVGLRFTTKKRPSHVNDLLDTYGPVLLVWGGSNQGIGIP